MAKWIGAQQLMTLEGLLIVADNLPVLLFFDVMVSEKKDYIVYFIF